MWFVVLAALFASASALDYVPNEYLVEFARGATKEQMQAHAQQNNVTMFGSVTIGSFSAYFAKMTTPQMQALSETEGVATIEPNYIATATQKRNASAVLPCAVEQDAPSWGLQRITGEEAGSSRALLPTNYADQAKISAYILDTGIYCAHSVFEGRAQEGFTAIQGEGTSCNDENGHGTHVAGTVGGYKYGVAQGVTLVAVKVLDKTGSGSYDGILAGMEFVANQCKGKSTCAANMSLGGSKSTILNAALNAMSDEGVLVAVAAGNEDQNAANVSPASAAGAIVVGSTEEAVGSGPDVRSYFSNFGSTVDVFAPGSAIVSSWIGGPTYINTISGTSMASPHVCGIAALYLSNNGVAARSVFLDGLLKAAEVGKINLDCGLDQACAASPNLMARVFQC